MLHSTTGVKLPICGSVLQVASDGPTNPSGGSSLQNGVPPLVESVVSGIVSVADVSLLRLVVSLAVDSFDSVDSVGTAVAIVIGSPTLVVELSLALVVGTVIVVVRPVVVVPPTVSLACGSLLSPQAAAHRPAIAVAKIRGARLSCFVIPISNQTQATSGEEAPNFTAISRRARESPGVMSRASPRR
jgi:hypothetical protein